MAYIATFERVEKKYLLTAAQHAALMPALLEHLQVDQYAESTICSLYLDTADHLLIRRSLDKPCYKEKMRLRSYGVPGSGDNVYLEIKKKFDGVVYKRRIALTAGEAMACIAHGEPLQRCGQIAGEIRFMLERYALAPAMVLCYDRTAYTEKEASADALRVTLDRRVRFRDHALDLRLGDDGTALLPQGSYLMELKTARALPLWVCHALAQAQVYPTSFSKYGQAYALVRPEAKRPSLQAV